MLAANYGFLMFSWWRH